MRRAAAARPRVAGRRRRATRSPPGTTPPPLTAGGCWRPSWPAASCSSCARRCPTARGRRPAGARARPRGRQHHRHGAVSGQRHERGRRRAVDRRRARGGARRRQIVSGLGISGGAAVSHRDTRGPTVRVAPGRSAGAVGGARARVQEPDQPRAAAGRRSPDRAARADRHPLIADDTEAMAGGAAPRSGRASDADGGGDWVIDGLGGPPRGDAQRLVRDGGDRRAVPHADARRRARPVRGRRSSPAAPPAARAGAGGAARRRAP